MNAVSVFGRLLPGFLVIVSISACVADSPTSPSGTAPFSQSDLRVGAGAAAASGDILTVNYTGWIYDQSKGDQKGLQFDTSAGRGTFAFTLGSGGVIPGWDQGLVGIRVGGLRRLVIPPSLAYGSGRQGVIPPNSTLVFEVELISIGPTTTASDR